MSKISAHTHTHLHQPGWDSFSLWRQRFSPNSSGSCMIRQTSSCMSPSRVPHNTHILPVRQHTQFPIPTPHTGKCGRQCLPYGCWSLSQPGLLLRAGSAAYFHALVWGGHLVHGTCTHPLGRLVGSLGIRRARCRSNHGLVRTPGSRRPVSCCWCGTGSVPWIGLDG